MDDFYEVEQKSQPQRSNLLTVLCILSLIGGGFSVLSNFFVVSLWDQIPEIMATNPFADKFGLTEIMEKTFSSGMKPLYITMLFLNIFSIVGVSMIWKLKELGLHFYIAAQVCLLIAPMIWIKPFSFPFLDIIITGIFIWLYATEMKRIKKQNLMVDNESDDVSNE